MAKWVASSDFVQPSIHTLYRQAVLRWYCAGIVRSFESYDGKTRVHCGFPTPGGRGSPSVGVNPEGDCMEITVTLTVTLQYPSVTLQYPSLTRYSV